MLVQFLRPRVCQRVTLVLILIAAWPLIRIQAQTEPPKIVGTWRLNVAKSKFEPGPPVKSRTQKWEWDGETLQHTSETVNNDGSKSTAHFAAKFDGKPYPVFANGNEKEPARFVRLKWIDSYSFESIPRETSGKENPPSTHLVSKDGKSFTIQQHSDAGNNFFVFEKQ